MVENLQQLEDDGESFDRSRRLAYLPQEDFFFNEDEYCQLVGHTKLRASKGETFAADR